MSSTILGVFIAAAVASHNLYAASFQSPNGVTEECRPLGQVPGGDYGKKDLEKEMELCRLDFYGNSPIALCPKTWSTSPGTMIYDITKSGLSQTAYEAQASCGGSKNGHKKVTKFKQSMNQDGTSGTYGWAGLLYYHFSRYFDTTVNVPVHVLRTMDRQAHFDRVTKKAHERKMGKGARNVAGWQWLYKSESNPAAYKPTDDLFSPDLKQIWGSLGDGGGEAYGPEFNGVRSAWGRKQNEDFQETPAFRALRSEKPIVEAMREGIEIANKDARVRAALGPLPSDFQMAVWMKEITEIVILDFIFNQQDRVGNIEFKWYMVWAGADGKVNSKKLDSEVPRAQMKSITFPPTMEGAPTQLVMRTHLNDNDAGGRAEYANFTRMTEMLQKIRHMNPKTYEKLMQLSRDFANQGPIYQYVTSNFGLPEKHLKAMVTNVTDAAKIIGDNCRSGKIRFDLSAPKKAIKGEFDAETVSCE